MVHKPKVRDIGSDYEIASLRLPGHQGIQVGTEEWFLVLESEFLTGFNFDSVDTRNSSFTARRETRDRGGYYWTAYKRIAGKLRKSYIGKSTDLTLGRLREVGRKLLSAGEVTQQPTEQSWVTSPAEDEDEEPDPDVDDPTDPTDEQIIKGQAKTIQTLRADVELAELKQSKAEAYCKTLENQLQRVIEQLQSSVTQQAVEQSWVTSSADMEKAIALLKESLTLKANAGGAIKVKVKQALERLGVEP